MAVEQKSQISRRAITKGIAWSVPAFAVATAAPALAQSPLVTFSEGEACKYGGSSQDGVFQAYLFPVTISNISHEPVTITTVSASVVWNTGGPSGTGIPEFWDAPPHQNGSQVPNQTINLSEDGVVGDEGVWYFVVDEASRSPQSSGTATLVVEVVGDVTGRTYQIAVSANFGVTDPCDDSVGATDQTTGSQSLPAEDVPLETVDEGGSPETSSGVAETSTSETSVDGGSAGDQTLDGGATSPEEGDVTEDSGQS